MKKLLLPAVLLSAYTIRLICAQASIAEALVFIALAGLNGFVFHTLEKQRPDPDKKLKDEISDIKDALTKVSLSGAKTGTPRMRF